MGIKVGRLSFIVFIPMTSKQKSSFLWVIKRSYSPYPCLRKNARVALFWGFLFCSICCACGTWLHMLCILSTYRTHAPSSRKKTNQNTPTLWKSWSISCFHLKCLSILTCLKRFYCHVGPQQWSVSAVVWHAVVADIWCFMAVLSNR